MCFHFPRAVSQVGFSLIHWKFVYFHIPRHLVYIKKSRSSQPQSKHECSNLVIVYIYIAHICIDMNKLYLVYYVPSTLQSCCAKCFGTYCLFLGSFVLSFTWERRLAVDQQVDQVFYGWRCVHFWIRVGTYLPIPCYWRVIQKPAEESRISNNKLFCNRANR